MIRTRVAAAPTSDEAPTPDAGEEENAEKKSPNESME